MVVQSKKSQIIILFFSVAFILSLGIIGYIFLDSQGRFFGEIILYLSLLFGVLTIFGYGLIFLRNRNILRELDKIIEMSKYNNFSPVQSLERLSEIGEKIGTIYKNVNQVSEKRALKISSLSALSSFLLDNVTQPIVITDIRGVVTFVSKQFLAKHEEYTHLQETPITGIFPDLKIQLIRDKFDENFSSFELRQGRTDLTVYPIRNRDLEISYLVFVQGKSSLIQDDTVKQALIKQPRGPERKGIFRKLLGRRK